MCGLAVNVQLPANASGNVRFAEMCDDRRPENNEEEKTMIGDEIMRESTEDAQGIERDGVRPMHHQEQIDDAGRNDEPPVQSRRLKSSAHLK